MKVAIVLLVLIIAIAIIFWMIAKRFSLSPKKRVSSAAAVTTAPIITPAAVCTTPAVNTKHWVFVVITFLVIMLVWSLNRNDSRPQVCISTQTHSYYPAKRVVKKTVATTEQPIIEIWNMQFQDEDGRWFEEKFKFTRTKSSITMQAMTDRTHGVVYSVAENSHRYTGTIKIDGVHVKQCTINLSGGNGSGWWVDKPVNVNLRLKRLS